MVNKAISKDGTAIAYTKNGKGPAVILIDGAFCSKDFGPMPKIVPLLSNHFTVISYDRRARGESGDTAPYFVEKELEDLNALIQMYARPVFVFAISSGAILALSACSAGLPIAKLALLEPPYVGNKNKLVDAVKKLQELIGAGKKGEAVRFYMKKLMGVPTIIPYIMMLTPNWKKMKANANSLPYDAELCQDLEIPQKMLQIVVLPTIVIDSTKSPASLRNAVEGVANAMPGAIRISLKGSVHDVPAKILVPVLKKFFESKA